MRKSQEGEGKSRSIPMVLMYPGEKVFSLSRLVFRKQFVTYSKADQKRRFPNSRISNYQNFENIVTKESEGGKMVMIIRLLHIENDFILFHGRVPVKKAKICLNEPFISEG